MLSFDVKKQEWRDSRRLDHQDNSQITEHTHSLKKLAQLSHNSMMQDSALSDVHFFNENNIYHLPQHGY
eukprot:2849624-Ditylum_brightwellii.AAC.1